VGKSLGFLSEIRNLSQTNVLATSQDHPEQAIPPIVILFLDKIFFHGKQLEEPTSP
jgi:hypothetical protein